MSRNFSHCSNLLLFVPSSHLDHVDDDDDDDEDVCAQNCLK